MKRRAYLKGLIIDIDNLRLAYLKAKKGKGTRVSVIMFERKLDYELMKLRKELESGTFEAGNYNFFYVFDPKKRLICAAKFRERVAQHAVMNICHDDFEKHQIDHSYASRKNKGVYKCLNQAIKNHRKYSWYLKLDCRKYFDSIDHLILMRQLLKLYKDPFVLIFFQKYLDSYHTEKNKGLPIGNLLSQYFANHYLSIADHFAQEVLKVSAYVRYMDDITIWATSKQELLKKGRQFEKFVAHNLQLTLKPFCLNSCNNELSFLGYLVTKKGLRISKKSKNRFQKKIKKYLSDLNSGLMSQEAFSVKMTATFSFIEHGTNVQYRYSKLENLITFD